MYYSVQGLPDDIAVENGRSSGGSTLSSAAMAASGIFGDPLSVTYDDPDHSREEQRYLTVGTARSGRLLIILHTGRAGNI